MKVLKILFLFVSSFWLSFAFAQVPIILIPSVSVEEREEQEASALSFDTQALIEKTLVKLETTRNWLGTSVGRLGANLDHFLSDSESVERYNGSKAILKLPLTYHLSGEWQAVPRLDAKIDLKQLNEKWKLFVRSFNEEEQAQTLSTTANEREGEGSAQIGVRYQTKRTLDLLNYIDVGVNAKGLQDWPSVYTRYKSKYHLSVLPQPWQQNVSGKVFWDSVIGVGVQLSHRLDYEMPVIQAVYRSETQFNWWDHGQYWDIYQDFILFQKISTKRSAASFLGWNWLTKPDGLHLNRFSTGVKIREKIYKQWLFFEVKPLVTFVNETHFKEADPSLTLQLEVQFYQEKQ